MRLKLKNDKMNKKRMIMNNILRIQLFKETIHMAVEKSTNNVVGNNVGEENDMDNYSNCINWDCIILSIG